jgi:hypothetical protein
MSKNSVAVLTFAFLAGCSSSSSPTPAGGGSATPAEFQAKLDSYTCAWKVKCGFIGASEQKACEDEVVGSRTKYPSPYDQVEAATAKRVTFDADAAAQCLAAAQALGCTYDQLFAFPDACSGAYKAAVAIGESCKADLECIGGYCEQGAGVKTKGCSGTCKAFLASGATCEPNAAHCASTDFCDSTTKKCTARVAAGGACGGALPGCAVGLFCKGYVAASGTTPATPGKCASAGAVGDACSAQFGVLTDCTPGLYCDPYSATPKCQTRLAAGVECSYPTACADGLACIGLVLDTSAGTVTTKGKCAAYLDVNKPCVDPAADATGCPFDTQCDAKSKLCAPYGASGADCSSSGTNGNCGENLYCDASSKCSPQVGLNAACTPASSSGADPCNEGSCDKTSKTCVLVCK